MADVSRPLSGIRVVELARVLAGPWAGQLLADLGADVIKVENPNGGDETRHWGPPFIKGAKGEDLSAAYFHSANRGKRSVTLDFKTELELALVKKLIATADVVIENYKVDGLVKYGLDYESVRKTNPAVVYCSITGFGQSGPYRERAGYDFIIQGMSGFMSITGEADGAPMKAGVAITDILTGLYATSAINASLVAALKQGTGGHIDIALFDVMTASLANQNLNYLSTGKAPHRRGNAHPNIAPYQVVPTNDGHVILAIGNDGQFARFCQAMGLKELSDDTRFSTNASRLENREDLIKLIDEACRKQNSQQLLKLCENNNIPAGPINTIQTAFDDPQLIHRELKVMIQDAFGTHLPGVRSPISIAKQPLVHERPSPRLGEHNEEILAELSGAVDLPKTD